MASRNNCIAVYPGTFDPLTNGHAGLVRRGLAIFDTVILAIAKDTPKKTLFSLEERVAMAQQTFADQPRVLVDSFEGLLVEYVETREASVILRGLRAVSDFELEFQLALFNRKLKRDIQTVFLMTDYRWLYISSTIIREAARLGGNVEDMVPRPVFDFLLAKYPQLKERHI